MNWEFIFEVAIGTGLGMIGVGIIFLFFLITFGDYG